MSNSCLTKLPVAFVTHGGGPMPLLGSQPATASFMKSFHSTVVKSSMEQIKAILVISAHWVTDVITVTSGANHPLMFDYSGFPRESYKYTYDAPGDPVLAGRIKSLLNANEIACQLDSKRGWDHGVFVPLKLMYPDAKIPVVAMSIHESYDPALYIKIGEALSVLREEGVLIIASGMSFHNFDYFFTSDSKTKQNGVKHSTRFNDYLTDAITNPKLSADDRYNKMLHWYKAESALEAHKPGQQEHLMPLHVVFGAAKGDNGHCSALIDSDGIEGIVTSNFHWN